MGVSGATAAVFLVDRFASGVVDENGASGSDDVDDFFTPFASSFNGIEDSVD